MLLANNGVIDHINPVALLLLCAFSIYLFSTISICPMPCICYEYKILDVQFV